MVSVCLDLDYGIQIAPMRDIDLIFEDEDSDS